jgi:hypothetical protein
MMVHFHLLQASLCQVTQLECLQSADAVMVHDQVDQLSREMQQKELDSAKSGLTFERAKFLEHKAMVTAQVTPSAIVIVFQLSTTPLTIANTDEQVHR